MAGGLILVLLALTTAAAYWLGSRRLGLAARQLPGAVGRAFETLGAALVFFAVNFGLSLLVAFGVRSYTHGFLSLHELSDWIVLALSLLQALVFQAWRSSPRSSGSGPAPRWPSGRAAAAPAPPGP